jgi:hypothetical protein
MLLSHISAKLHTSRNRQQREMRSIFAGIGLGDDLGIRNRIASVNEFASFGVSAARSASNPLQLSAFGVSVFRLKY